MQEEYSLSKSRRLGYGAVEVGITASETLLRVSLLIFYTQVVGLRADFASYAIALGVLWDAVTDPFMGKFSDDANYKGERRRPFFWLGSIGLALSISFLFNFPRLEGQGAKFLYLLVSYLSCNTFLTILSVPHLALAADITKSEKTRMDLFGWRLIFANIGIIVGTALPALFIGFGLSQFEPDSSASFLVGIILIVGNWFTMRSTKGLDHACQKDKSERKTYWKSLGTILSNKPYLFLMTAYMTATIGLTLNSSLALYYYRYFLEINELYVRSIIAFFMLIFCLSIPLWIFLTRFFTKEKIVIVNIFFLGLMTAIIYPLIPKGNLSLPILASILGGVFIGSVVLMDVAVAEIAEAHTKRLKETETSLGLYFGFWKMCGKFSRAIGLVLTGQGLTLIGFEAGVTPSMEVSQSISFLFGPGVGFFLILSAFILTRGIPRH